MTLYLAEDMIPHMDASDLPENITVVSGIPIF